MHAPGQTAPNSLVTAERVARCAALFCSWLALALHACTSAASGSGSTLQFPIEVGIESDPGEPVTDAAVARDGRELGRTAVNGMVHLSLEGRAGDVVALQVSCPTDYASPDRALNVTLLPLVGGVVPKYRTHCQPVVRSLVVAVRAKGGANLPIKYHGREIARTDADGAAHTLLKVPPAEQVTLVLDTTDPAHARLRPNNPELTVTMPPRDELAVFDQAFSEAKPPAPPRTKRTPPPLPLGPQKITGRP